MSLQESNLCFLLSRRRPGPLDETSKHLFEWQLKVDARRLNFPCRSVKLVVIIQKWYPDGESNSDLQVENLLS